ncbi:hypothetical protein Nepgr_017995 [Nepenthes gracilis]|uniref:Uncharacterized protein n=1 Tax=Nepenthes gracilis TaxID=150966 RepID=A0AAD3XTM6_NEPGR|nr:hypothetical protein Nepgr_017995 [Nepenthes gracilis]
MSYPHPNRRAPDNPHHQFGLHCQQERNSGKQAKSVDYRFLDPKLAAVDCSLRRPEGPHQKRIQHQRPEAYHGGIPHSVDYPVSGQQLRLLEIPLTQSLDNFSSTISPGAESRPSSPSRDTPDAATLSHPTGSSSPEPEETSTAGGG